MAVEYYFERQCSVARKRHGLSKGWASPALILYDLLTDIIFGNEVPSETKIGRGQLIEHGQGIGINVHAVIEDNCRIKNGATVECQAMPDSSQGQSPIIGDRLDIDAKSIDLGGATIGDYFRIGAGAIGKTDMPAGSIAWFCRADVYTVQER